MGISRKVIYTGEYLLINAFLIFFKIKVIRNSIYLVSSFQVCVKANKIKTFILLA